MGHFIICTVHQVDQIKVNRQMVGYVAFMGETGNVMRYRLENETKRNHLDCIGICGKIILRWIVNSVDRIHLAQNVIHLWTVVRFTKRREFS